MNLDEQTRALLRVSGGKASSGVPCSIEIDEYVPLRCRTYQEPLGAGYLRLGNYSTRLIELAIEPRVQVLRGVTITSISGVSPWPDFSVMNVVDQLPVVSTSFVGGEVVDLRDNFEVAARSGELIAFWGDLALCTGLRCGRTCFLMKDQVLAGAWFTGLTERETKLFVSHAGGV